MKLQENNNKQPIGVSVVIPVYNNEKLIGRAIDSILAQSRPADEIIVVDDGSTDNTADVVKAYSQKIKYIYQDNAGVSVARNTGIDAARFEWIAFLDSDDEWLSEKLKLQLELLRRNSDLVWVSSNYIKCLCDDNRKAPDYEIETAKKALGDKEYFDDFFQTSLSHGCGWTGTMLIKKEILKQAGMFEPGRSVAEDTDLWFRIACQWPQIGYTAQPLAIYHMNIPQSLSRGSRYLQLERELFKKQLQTAAKYNRLEAFQPRVARRVVLSIRSLLFENRPSDIRSLMDDFGDLLPSRFKIIVRILLIWPWATAVMCHAISRVVRTLHLRQKIIRRPRSISKQ